MDDDSPPIPAFDVVPKYVLPSEFLLLFLSPEALKPKPKSYIAQWPAIAYVGNDNPRVWGFPKKPYTPLA